VRGYPTIKFFGPTSSEKQSPVDYDGGRTASDIVTWGNNKASENAPAPELIELTGPAILEQECEQKSICVVAFLPQLFDCQSSCRNRYLALLKKMGDKFKRNQWAWVWTEAGKHPELETALQVGGFGFPALVSVNSRKGKYVLLRGSFSEAGINEYLRELSVGRGQTQQLDGSKLPAIVTVAAWDGKDAKIEVEEDINLDDVSLDDDVGGFAFRKKTVDEL
jgi:protein disulfide-isomerase A6